MQLIYPGKTKRYQTFNYPAPSRLPARKTTHPIKRNLEHFEKVISLYPKEQRR